MHWFSATQVETYLLCPRKWAWYKVAGIVQPPSPSLALGSAVHAQLEGWLRDGKPLDLLSEAGQIAMAGLHHLPAPGTPGLVVEQAYQLVIGGHHFRGAKDWQLLDRRPPVVGDHKTTKDYRWVKTVEELRTNIQAALYAADSMLRTQYPVCDLQWTYFKTSGGRGSQVVHLRVTAEEIVPTIDRVIKACDEMSLILRAGVRAEEVPINPEACEAFGGCPYQSICNLTPEQRFRAMMNQQATSDFLAKLQERNPSRGAPAGAINPPEAALAPAAPPPGQPWPDHAAGVWRAPDGSVIGPIQAVPATPPPAPAAPVQGPPPGAHISEDGKMWWNGATWLPVPPAPQAAPPPAAPPQVPAEAPARRPEEPAPGPRRPGRPRKNGAEAPPAQPPAPMQAPPANMGQQAAGAVLAHEGEDGDADTDRRAQLATALRQFASLGQTLAALVEGL